MRAEHRMTADDLGLTSVHHGSGYLALFGAATLVGVMLTPARGLARMVWHALHHEGDLAWLGLR